MSYTPQPGFDQNTWDQVQPQHAPTSFYAPSPSLSPGPSHQSYQPQNTEPDLRSIVQELWQRNEAAEERARRADQQMEALMKLLTDQARQGGASSAGSTSQQTTRQQPSPIPVQAPIPTPIQPPVPRQYPEAVKMEAPEAFDGDKKKLRSFRIATTIYFNANARHFSSAENRVWWILSRMKGEVALNWRDNKVEAYEQGLWVPGTEQMLWAEIEGIFGDSDMEASQVMKLKGIVQGNSTMDAHVAAFRIAARGTGYTGRPLVDEFKRSIDKKIRDHILMGEISRIPQTIEQWYTVASHIDRHWRNTKAMEQVYAQQAQQAQQRNRWQPQGQRQTNIPAPFAAANPAPARPAQQQQAPQPHQGVPMEVDRGQRVPQVCYKCRKPGHIARNCRSRVDVRAMTWEEMIVAVKEEEARKTAQTQAHFPNGNQ